MNILDKFLFYLKKPKIVIILGDDSSTIADLIVVASSKSLKIEKINLSEGGCNFFKILTSKIIIIERSTRCKKSFNEIRFLAGESSFPVLVAEKNAEIQKIKKLLKIIEEKGALIGGWQLVREVETKGIESCGVGFEKKSDLYIDELNFESGTNFKISNKGDVVPFWFNEKLTRDQIINTSLAVGASMALGLNLVEISQNLKN